MISEETKYLAYGSNLHPERLRIRGIGVELVATVRLPGWRLCFHKQSKIDGSAKCDIVESSLASAHVWCALYDIDPAHVSYLDRIEGLGSGYERRILELDGHGSAFTYVASHGAISTALRPYTCYRDFVVAGARHHRFPEAYVESIARVEATEDPDQPRNETNLATLAKLTYN